MSTSLSTFGLLPLMPMHPAWLEQSPAFGAGGAMLKGYVRLLFAAWRGLPVGSVSASHSALAETSGLPVDVVREQFETLTHGFSLHGDGRLYHDALAHMAEAMLRAGGKDLERFAASFAVSSQAPEQFGLYATEAASAKPRGKTALPKDFGYDKHPELLDFVVERGVTDLAAQAELMDEFCTWARSKDERYKDWAAAFMNSVRRRLERATAGGAGRAAPGGLRWSRSSGLQPGAPSRGEAAAARNAALFDLLGGAPRAAGGRTR